MECQYPTHVRGSSKRKAHTSPKATQETLDSSPEDDSFAESNQGSIDGSSILQDSSPIFDTADFTSTTSDSMMALVPDIDCSNTHQSNPYSFADLTTDISWNGDYDHDMAGFCFGNESWPTSPSSLTGKSNCDCVSQAVVTFEALEVAAWGRRKLINDINTLQSQKNALAECEKLVECQNCNIQPAYMMLLLSMLRKIVRTLEDVCSIKKPQSPQEATSIYQETHSRKIIRAPQDYEDVAMDNRHAYNESANNLRLDDEDKHLVLQSLLSARVGKSQQLLSAIDKVVTRHTWPAHTDLVRELRKRLMGRLLNTQRN